MMRALLPLLCIIGFGLSLYAYLLEQKMKQNSAYKPACDINDQISCTKPLMSEYNAVFGMSNSILGMLFYAGMFIIALLGFKQLVLLGSVAACGASVIFAYILFVKIKSFCLICSSIYLVNILLFLASWIL